MAKEILSSPFVVETKKAQKLNHRISTRKSWKRLPTNRWNNHGLSRIGVEALKLLSLHWLGRKSSTTEAVY